MLIEQPCTHVLVQIPELLAMDGSLPAASGTPLPPSSSPELALLAPDGPDLLGPSLRGDGARFEPLWTGNLGRETEDMTITT